MQGSTYLGSQAAAALGVKHQQLLAALNNPKAPDTLFIGSDPKNNNVTLQIDTTIASTLTAGATPVPPDDAPGSTFSLLYLNLTNLHLSDDEFQGIAVPGDWISQKYGRQICLAPRSDQPLSPGTGVGIKLPGFAMANPPPGTDAHLILTYYNVAGITVGDLGTPHDFKVLFQRPPDAKDRDLHDDLILTLPQPLVACSLKGHDPVSNTLSLLFQPNPEGGPATAGPKSVFEVTFVYADNPPGYGALCSAGDIADPLRGTNAGSWSLAAADDKSNPSWLLEPPAGRPIVGRRAEATVSFDFDSIVTWLEPGPTLMLVSYSNIPGYSDGSFQIPIVKVPHPDIEWIRATPNPAQLEDPAGVEVLVEWRVHDAGKLTLHSSAGLPQRVTGRSSWKAAGLTGTTEFKLEADGKFLADMGNTAMKSVEAVVIPGIEFSGTLLPDHSGVELTWDIVGAFYAQIEGIPGLQEPQGRTIIATSSNNRLPILTLRTLDAKRKELARATLKRRWRAGGSVPVGGNAMAVHPNTFLPIQISYSNGIAVSPDGMRLYAASGDLDNSSISVFDAATLKPIGTVASSARIARIVAFAFSPDSSKVYVVHDGAGNSGASLIVIDGKSNAVTAVIRLSDLASGFNYPSALVANDKYIFIKTRTGPVALLVLDAHTYAKVWFEPGPGLDNPDHQAWMQLYGIGLDHPDQGWMPISAGLALSRKRLYYSDNTVLKMVDCHTLAVLGTASVARYGRFEQIVVAADDSRTFRGDFSQVSTFPGPDWVNPTVLPGDFLWQAGIQGTAVTSDCRQVFLLIRGSTDIWLKTDSYIQLDELDSKTGSYVPGEKFLRAAGLPVAVALSPDSTRLFVGWVDNNRANAFITVLDASYA